MIHRLADLLKERGAKTRLAKKIGKNEAIISELCAGNDRLNDDLIKLISEGLGIPAWQLFVDPKDAVAPEFKRLIDGYLLLDPGRRAVVDDMMVAAQLRDAEDKNNKKK